MNELVSADTRRAASWAPRAGIRAARRLAASALGDLRATVNQQSLFIIVVLGYLGGGQLVAMAFGQRASLSLYGEVQIVLFANFALIAVLARSARQLWIHRPEHPIAFLWHDLTTGLLARRRLIPALPAFLLLPLMTSVFTSLKAMIPLIRPFSWDPFLIDVDRFLHGGVNPWLLLHPLLGTPVATSVLSNVYSLPWFVVIVGLQFWATFTLDPRKQQILISFVLCWALMGNGLATLFSSAGPCYYGYFFDGPDPFAAQLAHLASVAEVLPMPSSSAQAYLWETYQADHLSLGSGIAAMPSLHVSMALLLVFAAWPAGLAARTAALLFLSLIQIGSVYLAWHYAADGYVAMAGTAVIWFGVGLLVPRHARPALPKSRS